MDGQAELQQCLNKLGHWTDTNGFKFSTSKTVCYTSAHYANYIQILFAAEWHSDPCRRRNKVSWIDI